MEVQEMNKERLVTLATLKAFKEKKFDIVMDDGFGHGWAYKEYGDDEETIGDVIIYWNIDTSVMCDPFGGTIGANEIDFAINNFSLMGSDENHIAKIAKAFEEAQCDMVAILASMPFKGGF